MSTARDQFDADAAARRIGGSLPGTGVTMVRELIDFYATLLQSGATLLDAVKVIPGGGWENLPVGAGIEGVARASTWLHEPATESLLADIRTGLLSDIEFCTPIESDGDFGFELQRAVEQIGKALGETCEQTPGTDDVPAQVVWRKPGVVVVRVALTGSAKAGVLRLRMSAVSERTEGFFEHAYREDATVSDAVIARSSQPQSNS